MDFLSIGGLQALYPVAGLGLDVMLVFIAKDDCTFVNACPARDALGAALA